MKNFQNYIDFKKDHPYAERDEEFEKVKTPGTDSFEYGYSDFQSIPVQRSRRILNKYCSAENFKHSSP